MISLTSTMVMDSRVIPGARVHMKKFNVKNRAKMTLELAEYRAKVTDIYRQMLDTVIVPDETDENGVKIKDGDSLEVRERKAIQRAILEGEHAALDDAYIKPLILKAYVTRIEGVELDGAPVTVDGLLEGPLMPLADEIYHWMEANNGLPPFADTNSSSPSLSQTPEDSTSETPKTPTTATAA